MPFDPNPATARTGMRDKLGETSEDTSHAAYYMTHSHGASVQYDGFISPMAHQHAFAKDLCARLNRELWHDGQWVVLWAHPGWNGLPRQIVLAWVDEDGDVRFVCEDPHAPEIVMAWGADRLMDMAEAAYQEMATLEHDVGVREDQRIKAAQGQPSRNPAANSPIFKT